MSPRTRGHVEVVRADARDARTRSVAELTEIVLGRAMSLSEAVELIGLQELRPSHAPPESQRVHRRHQRAPREPNRPAAVWVGSVGYEHFRDNRVFAQRLRSAGVRRLIDVRELAISRRRGYAKAELKAALEAVEIEYVHLPRLGNPKAYRDLYKSGRHIEGSEHFRRLLLSERRNELDTLVEMLRLKRSALMCVEHELAVCHRKVILDALRTEVGVSLRIAKIC